MQYYIEHVIAAEMWWRTAALQAFAVLVQSISSRHPGSAEIDLDGVLTLLRPTLTLLTTHPILKHPSQAKGGPGSPLAGAAAVLQMMLMQVYSLVPPAFLVERCAHDAEALRIVCLEALKTSAMPATPYSSIDLLLPSLHAALDGENEHLGPWDVGGGPLEKALLQFRGGVGGPQATAWEAGLRAGVGYSAENVSLVMPSSGSSDLQEPEQRQQVALLYTSQSHSIPNRSHSHLQ